MAVWFYEWIPESAAQCHDALPACQPDLWGVSLSNRRRYPAFTSTPIHQRYASGFLFITHTQFVTQTNTVHGLILLVTHTHTHTQLKGLQWILSSLIYRDDGTDSINPHRWESEESEGWEDELMYWYTSFIYILFIIRIQKRDIESESLRFAMGTARPLTQPDWWTSTLVCSHV